MRELIPIVPRPVMSDVGRCVEFAVNVLYFDGRWVAVSPNSGFAYESYTDALEDAVRIAREEGFGIFVHCGGEE